MQRHWENHQDDFDYAKGITPERTCGVVNQLMDQLEG